VAQRHLESAHLGQQASVDEDIQRRFADMI
jgi:hypothetical protein